MIYRVAALGSLWLPFTPNTHQLVTIPYLRIVITQANVSILLELLPEGSLAFTLVAGMAQMKMELGWGWQSFHSEHVVIT